MQYEVWECKVMGNFELHSLRRIKMSNYECRECNEIISFFKIFQATKVSFKEKVGLF